MLVEVAVRGVVGDGVVVADKKFVLLSHNAIEMGGQYAAEPASHHNHVVFLEITGSGFSLLSEAQVVGVSLEQLLGCKIAN